MKKFIFALCAILLGAASVHAVPAKKIWRTYTQPDGTSVQLMLAGDEFCHYYITPDGEYMLRDDGSFRTVDEASIRTISRAPGRMKLPQTGMGRFTSNYPRTGDVHCLVFLVEYTDVKFKVTNPKDFYTRFCNAENFTDYGATGSVAEYFREQSNGKFRPVYDVFGPVPLKNRRSYYGGNSGGDDKNPEEMVTEAVAYYKNQIDYSKYDYDNDGYVDNIFILYAGQGEASYGPAESVWPHSFNLSYTGRSVTYNGKIVDSYTCTNEWEESAPAGIGTFCHEFSHTMGLPDLYHTTNSSANYTPGEWSVLDYGPYNNDGRTPPNYSIFERNAMGWMEPTVLDGPATITLDEISTNQGCIIPTDKNTEFFLFENRQQKGWDRYVPGHGMLIWHIDVDQSVFDNNQVNNTKNHQRVDIEEANNNANNETAAAGFPFPGTAKKTAFTSATTPALKTWAGKGIDLPITEITEKNGLITFNVSGGFIELDAPAGLKAVPAEDGSMTVSWNAVAGATDYKLSVYSKSGSQLIYVPPFNDYAVGNVTSCKVEGLVGETQYFIYVVATAGKSASDASEVVSVTTPAVAIQYSTPTLLPHTSGNGSFTLNWVLLPNAEDYLVTVNEITKGAEESFEWGFGTANTPTLPAGWAIEGTTIEGYTSTTSCGKAAPSLKLGSKNMGLTTSVYPTDITTLSFFIKGQSTTSASKLSVLGRASEADEWTSVAADILPVDYNSKGGTKVINMPAGIRQLQFSYKKAAGNVALDDIVITYGGEDSTPLEGYIRLSVGNVDHHEVIIRKEAPSRSGESATYEAFVEAVDADGNISRPSEKIRVTPASTSGIVEVEAENALTVNGRTVAYTGTPGQIVVLNAAGMTVMSLATDGYSSFVIPAPGFYIISTPAGTSKIFIAQ